jgi:bacterioferritin-associated ferredoxin
MRINIVGARLMYICICHGITDRDIAASARKGARSVRDLEQSLGVGTGCGRCRSAAAELLRECRSDAVSPPLATEAAPA